MNTNQSINRVSGDFDLTFQGLNLTGGMLSMAAALSGLKVAIKIDRTLPWEFEPEIVTIYPTRMSQLICSVKSIHFFEKFSSLYPSLVYPQRILTIKDGKKFRSKITLLIDFILNRDREIASLPIHFSKFPCWQILANHYQNGLLVQEFRFDRNKAIIEILQKCKQLGVRIFRDESPIRQEFDPGEKFTCLQVQNKTRELKIENFQLSFPNDIRIITRYFEMTSLSRDTVTIFQFQFNKKIDEELFLRKVFKILKSIGIESPDNYREELLSIFQNQFIHPLPIFSREYLISDPNVTLLNKYCMESGKRISKINGKKILFRKWLRRLKYNRFDGFGFRQLQGECDEKFDLAKQTGIEYEKFCYYFYRYRDSIDDLIEMAYHQLNLNRTNPLLVWEKVEREFILKVEEEIFS